MGNVVSANNSVYQVANIPFGSSANTDGKFLLWKLTRTMKAAGWTYKSSGNGNTFNGLGKDNTATPNPNSDLWNGSGAQIAGQSGSAATYSANPFTSTYTITGLTGMTSNSVGRILIMSSCNTATNNGVFRIVAFNSATSVNVFNQNGSTSENNNGRLVWQEMDFAAYVTGQTGSTASISTFANGRVVTLTGLTGMTPLSTNRYLTITGASTAANNGTFKILSFISTTSVTVINTAGVAPDANNGAISWKEMDPLAENYIMLQQGAWLLMQGPSTLKIPITSQSTGTFLKGENITQTTTGAQAEVIGYIFDTVATAGFLVAMPRVNGSGGGPLGWGTNLITGGTSGATVTPSVNPVEFVRETVFYTPNSTATLGGLSLWMQAIDNTNENASRFSVLAGSAGCTASVPPGGGGTGNTFPTPGTYVIYGDNTTSTSSWGCMSSVTNFGLSHFMCADCTYDNGRSADGSFCGATSPFYGTGTQINGSYIGLLWTRCDDQEDGDLDPYVVYLPSNTTLFTGATRTGIVSQYFSSEHFSASSSSQEGSSTTWGNHCIRGWRRRGFASGDAYQNFGLFTVAHTTAGATFNGSATGTMGQYNDPANIATRNLALIGEPIWVYSTQNTLKMRKGIMRWARLVSTGTATDLYNSGLYIQLCSSLPAFIVGPWDKRTTPLK
jgi:hypothetical protein